MKIVSWRFFIPHLELTGQDGNTFCISWTELRGGARQVWFESAARRKTPGLPMYITVSPRQALAARLLRQRAEWRDLDRSYKLPSARCALATLSLFPAAGVALILYLLAVAFSSHLPSEWGMLPIGPRLVTIFLFLLIAFKILTYFSFPLISCRSCIQFRLRHPEWVSLRVTRAALFLRRSDGFENRFPWADLRSIRSDGRMYFERLPDDPICIDRFDLPTWRLISEHLRRSQPALFTVMSDKQQLRRIVVILLITAIAAEIAYAFAMRMLEVDRAPQGAILSCAALLGCGTLLTTWLDRTTRKRALRRLQRNSK